MDIKRNFLNKIAPGLLAAGILLATVNPALAQSALDANWTVSITYHNISDQDTPVTLNLFPEGSSTPIVLGPEDLPASNPLQAGAASSFFVGSVNNPDFTQGNGIMASQQPLAATVVQFSQDDNFRMRLLYNGLDSSKSSDQFLVATTLLNKFDRTTVFSVQNTENQAIDVTVNFYDADAAGALAATSEFSITANSSKFINMSEPADTNLGSRTVFNGSAIITAALADTDQPAEVVAAASEYYVDRPVASNFEGQPLADAANRLFMATALCQQFGLDTFYAIQNASLTEDATVNITYYDLEGAEKGTQGPIQIGPGQKASPHTCNLDLEGGAVNVDPTMNGFTGSAVITSTGAPIVATGKAQASPLRPVDPRYQDVLTTFNGQSIGAQELAMPFVRWANDARFAASMGEQQRTYIAIQNVGDTTAEGVQAIYLDVNGDTIATATFDIPARTKQNTDANAAGALGQGGMNEGEFGYYPNSGFGGGVIIRGGAGAELIAIARVQNPGAGEDYNAVPVP